MLELNQEWQNELNLIQSDYPYFYHLPRQDNFGIGFWSKYPLKNAISINQVTFGASSISTSPTCHFQMALNSLSTILNVLVAHPIPPINAQVFEKRNVMKWLRMQAN